MRTVLVVAVCSALLGVWQPCAMAQSRGTAGYVARLVPEMCGSLPCNASGINFTRGEIRLNKLRQSDLVFSTSIGRISLSSVSPSQPGLQAQLSATLSYGADANGDCPQANSQVVVTPWATSSLTCFSTPFVFLVPCAGELFVTAVTTPACEDVDVIVENITAEVFESGFLGDPTHRIAIDGLALSGRLPDCNSGGTGGCP
jgi:hypothetical protein